jgi:hypothetical protein
MELQQLKVRLDMLDAMVQKMDATPARVQGIKRTVFVLRSFVNSDRPIPSPYGPNFTIIRFSLQ